MTTKKIHINILHTTNELPTQRKLETDKYTKQRYHSQRIRVSAFDDYGNPKKKDWKDFYEKQLSEIKSLYPNATHNELTSIISKKWKKAKKNLKYFDQLAQKIKKEPIKNNSESILNSDNNLENLQLSKESDQIIEKLRSSSIKLILNNLVHEIKGETILDAINQNRLIIYLNHPKEIQNTKQEDTYNCMQQTEDDQIQDKEQDKGNDDNFQIVNSIKDYL
ncbi:unnamed protein product (macronuclear) [Paramecium tetraurelia]|uniref:HMG box domain-containing protein n=1 Tax=Paramecium tetraurelia TaxID=5888 RepID=A0DKJ7_PARTE|nr:uncharacterized protein GSPATT00017894001 [Paramecium tetraurelia]CAK83564.1 unnamed protein product [Paramecium tetraurelia]|eukprot:XP_001450961.1 hypothetical protein (macronuclear) [Paramecium tetraurelia strain d4-2]